MSRDHLRINRFGFAEYEDMEDLSRELDVPALAGVLESIVDLIFAEESGLFDSLTDAAEADFVVPLGMCSKMLDDGGYSAVELISAASTVRYCAESHMSEFPAELVELLSRLPR